MNKQQAFSLTELLVVLAILMVGLTSAVPGMRGLLDKSRLKNDVSRMMSVIDNGRQMAFRSECNTRVVLTNLSTQQAGVRTDMNLLRDSTPECIIWFQSSGLGNVSETIDLQGSRMTLSPHTIEFASGGLQVLNGGNTNITLLRGNGKASFQVKNEGFSEVTYE